MLNLDALRELRSKGMVSAEEFVQLATEISRSQAAEIQSARSELTAQPVTPGASRHSSVQGTPKGTPTRNYARAEAASRRRPRPSPGSSLGDGRDDDDFLVGEDGSKV